MQHLQKKETFVLTTSLFVNLGRRCLITHREKWRLLTRPANLPLFTKNHETPLATINYEIWDLYSIDMFEPKVLFIEEWNVKRNIVKFVPASVQNGKLKPLN